MQNLKEGIKTDPKVACDKCGSPMVIKVGKFGPFIACSAYPECTNTRELETQRAGLRGRRDEDEPCENCGKPMVDQARPLRPVPRVHRLSRVQDHAQAHRHQGAGSKAAKPDQILDEKCPQCESNLVIKQGRFGEFTACTQVPGLQVRQAEDDGRPLPQGRRRHRRAQVEARQGVLRLLELPGLRLHALEPAGAGDVPECGAPFLVEKITKQHGRQLICNNEECDYVRSEELAPA